MPHPISGDMPSGSTSEALSDVLPEWPLAAAVLVEPPEEDVGAFDGDSGAPVLCGRPEGAASPEWGSPAGLAPPVPGRPGAPPVAGAEGAVALPSVDAPGTGTAGVVPGLCGPEGWETLAVGVPDGAADGGLLVRGVVGSGLAGLLGSGSLGSGSLGLPDSGLVGSGLLVWTGSGVGALDPEDGDGAGVCEEPSSVSSTLPRPRVSVLWADRGADAAADNPVAAWEAGTPAVTAKTAASAAVAAPRRRPLSRPIFFVAALDLKINMIIEPSRNRVA
jgi:hypothetical protein